MSRQDSYTNTSRFCVSCGSVIGPDRTKKAITCSKTCSEDRNRWWRSMQDAVKCRYCMRPSTPEERSRFARFRAWEKKNGEFPVPARKTKPPAPQEETHDHEEATEAAEI